MKYKNNEESNAGDVIRWNCYDSEENTVWKFTGLVTHADVVYLGGGIDFGLGIGSRMTKEDVIYQSNNNDSYDRGIEKIGVASDLYIYISNFNIGVVKEKQR
jgi:hypothetical protein